MSAAAVSASPTPPPSSGAAASPSVASSSSSNSSTAPAASGSQTWLLKLPVFVAEQFRRALQQQQQQQQNAASSSSSAQSAPLATLHVSYTADGQQQLMLRYTPTDPTQPKEFVVRPRNKRHMLVFTEKQQPAATQSTTATNTSPSASAPASASSSSSAIAASTATAAPQCKYLSAVSMIADVVPSDTASYRSLVSRRTASLLSHSNTQRLVETDGFITPQVQQEMERKRRREEERKEERREAKEAKAEGREREREPTGSKGKRVRGSREEVESQLLRLFSESRFLSLRQLQEATQQPVNFLKEVMADMCVRETRGDNKDKYQLNEKYRIDD